MLAQCLAGHPPAALPPALLEEACAPALFSILVEGLADRFEPALCDIYVRLFSQAVAQTSGEVDAAALVARYQRVRRARAVTCEPRRVFVLSRVTLGADVAVTSVLLDAAKRRFPHARIVFVGPQKNFGLFAGDSRLEHAPVAYQRGSLRSRLAVGRVAALAASGIRLVLDPDSRLTQLGLLPICPDERYHLFESRAYGGESDRSLPELAAAWAAETFGTAGAKPYVSLGEQPRRAPYAAVSLGVGENPAKRLPDPFEEELLRLLAAQGLAVCIDKGAGGEEAERVARAAERSGVRATSLGRVVRGFRRHHSRQPALCGLRFGGPARGGGLWSASGECVCRVRGFPHVPPLASGGRALPRDPGGPARCAGSAGKSARSDRRSRIVAGSALRNRIYFAFFCFCWPTRTLKCNCLDSW